MIVDVAFPIPSWKTFSYMVPGALEPLASGYVRVQAPFGNRVQVGYIVGKRDGSDNNLKSIIDVLDFFPLTTDNLVELGTWASHYYVTPPGLVLKYLIPPSLKTDPYTYIHSENVPPDSSKGLPLKKAIRLFGRANIHRDCIQRTISFRDPFTDKDFTPIRCDRSVSTAVSNTLFIAPVENRLMKYMSSIEEAFQQDQNVLMLLPDKNRIGRHFRKLLEERFEDRVLWHGSGLASKSRMSLFFQVRNNGKLLVLGNKSCVFLPIRKLGLIIIERPEEDEYRNEEAFKFNAVTVALKRASLEGARCLIGSVCPPVEVYHYCDKNGFTISEQKWLAGEENATRFESSYDFRRGTLHENLTTSIEKWTRRKEHIAIFVPWRFYGSGILCHSCREARLCPECGSMLSYEKDSGSFACMSCLSKYPYDTRCPNCGGDIVTFSRFGLEYVAEKLHETFPDLEIERITGDDPGKKRRKSPKLESNKPVLLIGTQSLSKMYGIHVTRLVLIGFEELRTAAGYRSDEKMRQVLMNLVDALTPEHVLFMNAKRSTTDHTRYKSSIEYYQEELKTRKIAEYPPYKRIFLMRIRDKDQGKGERAVELVSEILRKNDQTDALAGTIFKKRPSYLEWNTIIKGNETDLHDSLRKIYDLKLAQIEPDPMDV